MLSPILAVRDIDASIAFYVNILGFTENWKTQDDNGHTNFACVRMGDAEILLGVIEGFVDPVDLAKRGIGIQIYVDVPENIPVDNLYDRAVDSDALIIRGVENRDWGVRSFVLRDPDGYQLMMAQRVTAVDVTSSA
jgi:catechol 2,3-dioxygenase-like lactoylglutathione lyase family enzyme